MKIGFIGLGAMGAPMALNLHKAGKLKLAWNRTFGRVSQFAKANGIALAKDPITLARECELIFISVSRDEDLLEVIERVEPGLAEGKVVVDTSTVSIQTARQVAERLAKVGVAFLDAPLSGGVEGARQGTLTMMVGGDEAVLARVRPVLEVVAGRITHLGQVGNGQGAKAVNQVMAAGILQGVTESLAFGQAMGLPMDKVIEALASGAAGNWFLSNRGPSMLKQEFTPGFKIALHHKDLTICKRMAETLAAQLPIVEMTLIHYNRLMDAGFGDEDISALFRQKQWMLEQGQR